MRARAGVLVLGLALLWGSGFFWIRLALDGLSPAQLTFARLALGALLLAAVVTARHLRWPRGATVWRHLIVAALTANAIPYTLFAVAEQTVPSSLAGALTSTTPLWTALIALRVGTDRPMSAWRVTGLLVGLIGAVAILSPWTTDGAGSAGGLAACVAAAASYGLSYVYQASYLTNRGLPPLVLAAAQLAVATVLLAAALPVAGRDTVALTPAVLTATLVLGFLGTGLAYVINFALIATEGATAASAVTYLVPAVSVALGVGVLGEPLRATLLPGVVLTGVALVRAAPSGRSPRRRLPRPPRDRGERDTTA